MIKENHEHLADRQVLSAGVNPAHYRAQLLNHTLGVNVFRMGNQFNHSLTIKRFKMMKKPMNSPGGIIKMTMLVPALLIAMGLTTGMTPQQQKTITGKVVIAETGEPAPGAAVVVASTYAGTVADLDGNFTMDVEGNPEIVISFVGFKTLRVKASEIGKKALKLEEEIYKMDLDTDPVQIKEEAAIAREEAQKEREDIINSRGEIFYVVEDMPKFPGGKSELKTYIYSKLEYPAEMKKKGINGEVMVQFTVAASGELRDIRAVSSTHKDFEAPAVRVFEGMPNWSPGKQRGKPVKVNVVVPVKFNSGKG